MCLFTFIPFIYVCVCVYCVLRRFLIQWSSDVRRGKLDNGMKYYLLSNDYKPERVTTYLRVEVGSLDEEDNERGIAHFIEHMAFDRSKQFPARGGGWDAITKSGAGEFNAFTTFRTTTFQIFNLPASKFTEGLGLHLAQVSGMDPADAFVKSEVGAILGEARFRNGTDRLETSDVLLNHGGAGWRIPQRLTIGLPEQIKNFTAAQMASFYAKWYRPDRFTLIAVGNLTLDAMEQAVRGAFAPLKNEPAAAPAHPGDGTIRVQEPIVLRKMRGVDGIEFHLLCTRNYTSPANFTANYHREENLRKILVTAYALLVHVRLAEMYPEEILADFNGRDAAIKIHNEYQVGIEAHVWTVSTPGDPQTGTWRRDFEIALTELRRIAVHGIHGALLYELQNIVANQLREGLSRSGWEDSEQLADHILGSGDSTHVFTGPEAEARAGLPFLTEGFLESAQAFVQAEAQFLYTALVKIAGADVGFDGTKNQAAFPGIEEPTASLFVFMGSSAITRTVDEIVVEDIKKAIYQIENSVPPPNILIDRFMLILSRGLKIGGIEIPGTAPPIGIPKSGSLFNRRRIYSKVTWPQNIALQANPVTGIQTFKLLNGVRINVKLRASGNASLPDSEPGRSIMQVVSLGGKATERKDTLRNACKFVNMGLESGYSATYYDDEGKYDTTDFDAGTVTSYFKGAKHPASLSCLEEFFVIEKELHPACEIFPERDERECDPSNHNYFDKLEGIRLAMSPMYDARSVELAADRIRFAIDELEREADPSENLRYNVLEAALQELYVTDSRMARPAEADIRALDPLTVQAWVREQFHPDRIEINVVGDVHIDHLIIGLNMIFGTLPSNVTSQANTTDREHTQHRYRQRL